MSLCRNVWRWRLGRQAGCSESRCSKRWTHTREHNGGRSKWTGVSGARGLHAGDRHRGLPGPGAGAEAGEKVAEAGAESGARAAAPSPRGSRTGLTTSCCVTVRNQRVRWGREERAGGPRQWRNTSRRLGRDSQEGGDRRRLAVG